MPSSFGSTAPGALIGLDYSAGGCYIKSVPTTNMYRIVGNCVGAGMVKIFTTTWHFAFVDIFSKMTAPNIAIILFVVTMDIRLFSHCLHVRVFSHACDLPCDLPCVHLFYFCVALITLATE